ncbi:MAG: hypothetical protein WBW81_04970 [Methylocella sp.]
MWFFDLTAPTPDPKDRWAAAAKCRRSVAYYCSAAYKDVINGLENTPKALIGAKTRGKRMIKV